MDMYLSHFGLEARPFTLVPDPDFIYWTPAHKRAWTMLEYGLLTRAPITLITGEIGAGKTTLVQHLLRSVDVDVTVGLVSNAHGDRGELLLWALMALGRPVDAGASYVQLFAQLQDLLIEEYSAGRHVALIIDEAQNLSRESLEELRMFTNINANKDELVQLILVGQPELRDIVRQPDLKQFAQRVAANFHLPAMSPEHVDGYIAHRMQIAGGDPETFTQEAVGLVHYATGGVPRLINQLCDLALLYAFEADMRYVSADVIRQILEDDVFFGMGEAKPLRLVRPETGIGSAYEQDEKGNLIP